jgi:gamma-glutamyltranspeptidase/glutathione hydrolase
MKATKPMHYQIVDSKGNQFLATTTWMIIMVPRYCDELGFWIIKWMISALNLEFLTLYGLTGSEAQQHCSLERMLSLMTPTIVEKDNKFSWLGTLE